MDRSLQSDLQLHQFHSIQLLQLLPLLHHYLVNLVGQCCLLDLAAQARLFDRLVQLILRHQLDQSGLFVQFLHLFQQYLAFLALRVARLAQQVLEVRQHL